jgi:hypothetical protein
MVEGSAEALGEGLQPVEGSAEYLVEDLVEVEK